MKILFLADITSLKMRMHKISWVKIEAMMKRPEFVCIDVHRIPYSTLGRENTPELVKEHNPDIIIHDALWGDGSVLAVGLENCRLPRALMVEDYNPFIAAFEGVMRRNQFSHFITIPLVAKQRLPHSYWIGHYIPTWFDDYGAKKDIDVLFYGHDGKVYPLRTRLRDLMAKQDLRFFAIPERSHIYGGKEYVGEHLARTINRAHLTISCTSTANYMVKKYLEVPACKSTVLGDVNEECKLIFPNNEGILEVSSSDSDDEIVNKVFKFLENPASNEKAFEIARSRSPDAYAQRLLEIAKEIVEGSV